MSVLPKSIHSFKIIPIKIPARFFVDINVNILKFMWKNTGTRIAKTILKKTTKIGGISLPDFKTYITIVIKIVWY